MKLYGAAIIVNTKFATEKPEAVKASCGDLRGLKETIRRPADAIDLTVKREDTRARKSSSSGCGWRSATEAAAAAAVVGGVIVQVRQRPGAPGPMMILFRWAMTVSRGSA